MRNGRRFPTHTATSLLLTLILLCLSTSTLHAQRHLAQQDNDEAMLDQLLISKDSGLLTDWAIVGPFGTTGTFNQAWAPETDHLQKMRYGSERVFTLQFPSGEFKLPANAPRHGIYYASSDVWLPNGGDWRLYAETAGEMIVYLDGKPAITRTVKGDLQTTSEVVHLDHGMHHVFVKFTADAAPFHLAVMPQTGGLRKHNNIPDLNPRRDSQNTSAELRYPN